MSKGSKRRKRPATPAAHGTPNDRQVWLVLTDRDTTQQDTLRDTVERSVWHHGWALRIRRSTTQRVRGGRDKDRPYRTLSPRDARDLYQAAHEHHCLVVATHACNIRADPSKDPTTVRELVDLGRYVKYKCAYTLARHPAQAQQTVDAFARWPPPDGCRDHHDPRALPLHVFDPTLEWADLDDPDGTARFDRRHARRAGTRTDPAGHEWQQPTGRHGAAGPQRLAATVAGVTLPAGYHWDVQRAGGRGRVVSESAVWLLRRRDAYLNAYPNGHLRGAPNAAQKVWSC